MSKFVKNEKALKAVMAGAIALTPVIAVGVNAEKTEAATSYTAVNNFIAELNKAVDGLNADEKKALQDAHKSISDVLKVDHDARITRLLEDPTNQDAKDVVGELVNFLAASTTAYNMEAAFNQFDTKVTDSKIKAAFNDQDLTKEQFVNFLVYVEDLMFDRLGTNQDYSLYYDTFYSVLLDALKNDTHNDVAVAIAKTVKEDLVKDELKDIVNDAGITQAQKNAFEKVAEIYKANKNTGGGGGGGTVPVPVPGEPVVDDKKGQVTAQADAVVNNPQLVIDAINKATDMKVLSIALKPGQSSIEVPFTIASALKNKNAEGVIAVVAEHAAYHLPVAEIDAAAAAQQLGVTTAELKLVVSMSKVTNPLAGKTTYKVLSDAVDYTAALKAPNGKTVELTVFVKPVQRTILSTQTALDPVTTVGVLVDANGNIKAVPTYVTEDKKNADLYRAGNSTYTLIENFKTFNDVNNGKNWAEDYIERLASKMVVNGTTATTFAPDRSISRGEFAALLSRGLGLTAQNKTVKFSDVSANQAFNQNGEIASVVEAKIVQGDKNGKFRPYDTITRDEAAIMISRAMDFIDSEFVKLEPGKKVSHFEDYRYIGGTARPHVEKVYQAGYLGGYSNGTFGPANETERAQMAKILYNFLQSIHYIN